MGPRSWVVLLPWVVLLLTTVGDPPTITNTTATLTACATCGTTMSRPSASANGNGAGTIELRVTGMTCAGCARRVRDALQAVHGVELAEASVERGGWARVRARGVAAAALVAAVEGAGEYAAELAGDDAASDAGAGAASRVVRRFRCGCRAVSCCCSERRVLPGDPGVLITVFVDDPVDVRNFGMGDSCKCGEVGLGEHGVAPVVGDETLTEGESVSLLDDDQVTPFKNVTEADPDTEQLSFSIEGITCGSCVSKLERVLGGMEGVHKVEVGLMTSRAVLIVSPQTFDTEKAVQALANIGFYATLIRTAPNGDDAVYFRFRDAETASRALAILNSSPHVFSSQLHSELGVHTNHIPAPTEGEHAPPAPTAAAGFFARLYSYVKNVGKRDGAKGLARDVVVASCSRKVAAAGELDARDISYDVIPETDPIVCGAVDASEALRKDAYEYLRLFVVATVFTLPLAIMTMLLSHVRALGSDALHVRVNGTGFRVVDIIALCLATPVQFICGFRFYRGSWFALKQRRANMDVLIAAGTSIAYFFSIILLVVNTVQLRRGLKVTEDGVAFETAALLITIVLFGKYMETVAKRRAALGVQSLVSLAPRVATIVSPPPQCAEITKGPVPVELVSVGDYLRVNTGVAFPVDGKVVMGLTTVDESMLTGESWPVKKAEGDVIYAGTVNGKNSITMRCTATGSDAMLSKIVGLVQNAQASRAPIEAFADRISAVFVPCVVIIAILTTIVWFSLAQAKAIPSSWAESEGNIMFAVLFGLSVLVISCPCALGLATPTAVMMATSIGARRLGVLFKDGGKALQAANGIRTVLFDKTGTLTAGAPRVTVSRKIELNNDHAGSTVISPVPEDILDIVACAETYSDHPIAHAIVAYATASLGKLSTERHIVAHETLMGRGIKCRLTDGREVLVGEPSWILESCSLFCDKGSASADNSGAPKSLSFVGEWQEFGKTVVLAAVDGAPVAALAIEDPVRTEAADVISYLQHKGITCVMVSGDSEEAARFIAKQVGIEAHHIRARTLPADKVIVVHEYAADGSAGNVSAGRGYGVAFCGDGVNDAGALAAADVGIAIGSGSQIAAESAGIVLVRSNLWDVVVALDLARKAFRRVKLNYVWALGYNSLGIPLAAGAVFPFIQRRIPPYLAAIAMAASSLTVVVSSLALGRYKIPAVVRDTRGSIE